MAPKKLSDADKQQILKLYRQSDETTSSLANRYSVSVSTISRLLKQTLSDEEYEGLIQQKRAAGRGQLELDIADDPDPSLNDDADEAPPVPVVTLPAPPLVESAASGPRRQRRRSSAAASEPVIPEPLPEPDLPINVGLEFPVGVEDQDRELTEPFFASDATVLQEVLAASPEPAIADPEEDFEDLEEDEDDLDDDLDDEDDEDDEDFGPEDGDLGQVAAVHIPQGIPLRILPLSEASIPRTCYLVVDRSSELITRPLRDFADLGQIPDGEVQEKTLPIFDNHRIAKRFMRRMQRVVKVPDGRVLQKVGPYLQAKGITRLLIDGQVYSLN